MRKSSKSKSQKSASELLKQLDSIRKNIDIYKNKIVKALAYEKIDTILTVGCRSFIGRFKVVDKEAFLFMPEIATPQEYKNIFNGILFESSDFDIIKYDLKKAPVEWRLTVIDNDQFFSELDKMADSYKNVKPTVDEWIEEYYEGAEPGEVESFEEDDETTSCTDEELDEEENPVDKVEDKPIEEQLNGCCSCCICGKNDNGEDEDWEGFSMTIKLDDDHIKTLADMIGVDLDACELSAQTSNK